MGMKKGRVRAKATTLFWSCSLALTAVASAKVVGLALTAIASAKVVGHYAGFL